MGFRFRRSLRILPGLRLNVGKRGTSVSIGGRGATVNISKRGTRATLSAPGTGLSYSTTLKPRHTAVKAPGAKQATVHADVPRNIRPPALGWAIARLLVFAGMLAIAVRIAWILAH